MPDPVTQPPRRTIDIPRLREAVAKFIPFAVLSISGPDRVDDLLTLFGFITEGTGPEDRPSVNDPPEPAE
jgi:hypothetical protein